MTSRIVVTGTVLIVALQALNAQTITGSGTTGGVATAADPAKCVIHIPRAMSLPNGIRDPSYVDKGYVTIERFGVISDCTIDAPSPFRVETRQ